VRDEIDKETGMGPARSRPGRAKYGEIAVETADNPGVRIPHYIKENFIKVV
jgi:hypothetical protein